MTDNLMRPSAAALRVAGIVAPPDAPAPQAAVAQDTLQPSPAALLYAHRQAWRMGGDDARMAEFPERFAVDDEDKLNVWERGARGIASGFASVIPASMTLAGGIVDFMGADQAGQGLAQKGIDLQAWLNENVAVENPQFFDHLMSGVGSMASFLLPGLGVAGIAGRAGSFAGTGMKIASALGKSEKFAGQVAKVFQSATGSGVMSFLESAVEQSQRQQELMAQGMSAEDALKASEGVFWQNMALLTVSNALGYFSPVGKLIAGSSPAKARIAQGVISAFTEGGQERVQAVIQDVAAGRGRWEDFADPSKYGTETLVGSIVGGVAGGLTAETGQKSPTEPGEKAPSALPEDDLPLPDNFDLAPDEDEEAPASPQAVEVAPGSTQAPPLAQSPAQQEVDSQGQPVDIVAAFKSDDEGMSSVVMKDARGFTVRTRDEDSGEILPSFTTFTDQQSAILHARKIVGDFEEAPAPAVAPVAAPEPTPAPAQEPVESAPPEPAAVAEPAGSPAGRAEAAPANIATLPIETIATDPETFQARSEKGGSGVDEEFVRNAVESFDEQAVNPIEVWMDPKTGKYTVLDGHHTLEIMKRVGKKVAAVKIFKGTREEAIKASQERNDSRRENDVLARAAVVRGWRDVGMRKKAIKDKAGRLYGKNAPTVIALSHLNPNGRVVEALRSFSGADDVSITDLTQIAKWIGTVRAGDSKITDAHEGEMFDYLRKNLGKPGARDEVEFRKYIDGRIGGLAMFDYSGALNLNNAPSRTPTQTAYDAQLADARRSKKAAEAELKAASKKFKEMPADMKTVSLKRYEDAVTLANREVLALEQRETEINNSGRNEPTMFKILPAQRKQFSKIADKYRAAKVVKEMTIAENEVGPEASLVTAVAKRLGAKVQFFRAEPGRNGRTVGGFYNPATQTIFLNLDAVNREPLLVIAMHELGHHMQFNHPAQWRQMYFVALDNISASAKAAHEAMKADLGYTPDQFAGELMSDIMEEAGARESFWNKLAEEHPSAFANAVAKIRDIIAAIKTVFAANPQFKLSKHLKSIERMDAAIANAMRIAAERTEAGQKGKPTDQRTMFKVLPPLDGNKVMDEQLGGLSAAKKRIAAKERRITEFPRVIYQKMVDRNTWLYVGVRKALKAAGIDLYKYDMSKRPDLVLQKMAAWTAKADNALKVAVMSWDGNTKLADGLQVIIKKFGLADAIDEGKFGQFLIAARYKAMHDVLGDEYFGDEELPSGEPNPQYEAAKAEFDRYMAIYDTFGTQAWQDAAKAITDWSNAIMQRLLESGAISQEQYEGITEKYDIYAPLHVLEREEENKAGVSTKPKPTAGRVTWAMDTLIPGMTRQDPMEGLVKNVYRIEFLAANNYTKLSGADFIIDMHKAITGKKGTNVPGFGRKVSPKTSPVTKYVEDLLRASGMSDEQIAAAVAGGLVKTTENKTLDDGQIEEIKTQASLWITSNYMENGVVALMRNGKVEYWQFEPAIFDVYSSINDKASHQLMTYFTLQTRLLRAGAVLTPEFMSRNQFRDMLSAGVLATNLVKNPVDAALLPLRILRGLTAAIEGQTGVKLKGVRDVVGLKGEVGEVWQRFLNSDAAQANLVALDQENLKKSVNETTRAARTPGQKAAQAAKSPVKYLLHSHPLSVLQTLSKLTENSTRIAVLEKTRSDMLAQGMTEKEATFRASMQAREASTDFGRAGEYGRVINRIVPFFNASIQGNDKMIRALVRDKGNRGATWLRGTLMVTLPSVLLWTINHDEEWYKEQPAWLKNHFWLFSVDGGKTIIKLPKPFEIGMIFGSLPERFLDFAYGEDPEAVGKWADNFRKDIGVLHPSGLMGPTIGTIVEIEQNYDAYRDTPIVKGWLEDVIPREQYTTNTQEFSKWMAEKFPGGKLSPLMIDHFIRGAFGGIGTWAEEGASNIIMEADPKRREMKPSSRLLFETLPEWTPIVKAFADATPTKYTQQLDDIYGEYDRTKEAITTLRSFASGGAPKDKYLRLYKERGVDVALHETLAHAIEPISKISQQIKLVQSVPPEVLTRDERRQKIDELMAQRNAMVGKFMEKYRAIDKAAIQKKVDESLERVGKEYDRAKGR